MPQYEYEKDFPFAAFITNLGKYNEGKLVGEWVKFPTTYEKLQEVFKRIGIGEKDDFGYVYEEWFITDYDCYVGGLYDKLGEYENLDELNYLASKLDDMDRHEYNQFLAAMEMGEHTGSLQDIINLTENLDCYDVYPDIEDHDDLGRYYIEELSSMEVPEYLRGYIDYEAYGRDVALEEGGTFSEFGYIRDTGSSFHEFYDGDRDSIPEEYRVMSSPDGDELTEEEKTEWARDIAFELDIYFRDEDPHYAAENPDPIAQQQVLFDKLMAGRLIPIEDMLRAMGKEAEDEFSARLTAFKEATDYQECLDVDTDAIRAVIQNPNHSRVDGMLSAAEQAEREYAAEAAAYVQSPADIIRQAQAMQEQPDDHLTGQTVQTPRGNFHVTGLSKEQMEAAGYGIHHNSDDGRYHIMGNGTRAFAVINAEVLEQERRAEAIALAAEIDTAFREYSFDYAGFFPKEDAQRQVMAEAILEGRTPEIKTGLINLSREMDIRAEVAPLISKLDAYEKTAGIGTYMVYQLKGGDETRDLRFESMDRLTAMGQAVDAANYELVYAAPFTPGETLETIYRDLNVDRPENFHGHSLSMSDVVVLREYGKDSAHYCDRTGFTEVPQFLENNPLRTVELTVEDDYGMIDGVVNNGRRDEPHGKTSIRDRLEAAKQEIAGRKPSEPKKPGRNTPEHGDL